MLVLFFICVFSKVAAQEKTYMDTITVTVKEKVLITIATINYKTLFKEKIIYTDIYSLQSNISKIKTNIPVYQNFKIEYIPGKSLLVKEIENKKYYQLKDNKIESFDFGNECFVNGNNYTMSICFADINELLNKNLKNELEQFGQSLQKEQIKINTVSLQISVPKDSTHNDSLNIILYPKTQKRWEWGGQLGVGAGLIKNEWFNSLSYTLSVIHRKNGINKTSFNATIKGFPTFTNNDFENNTFAYMGVMSKMSDIGNKQQWIGFQIGTIVRNEGNFFGKDMHTIGTLYQFGMFRVIPELYFTKFLNIKYMGLQIEFGFL
jgi:hypothetical protein